LGAAWRAAGADVRGEDSGAGAVVRGAAGGDGVGRGGGAFDGAELERGAELLVVARIVVGVGVGDGRGEGLGAGRKSGRGVSLGNANDGTGSAVGRLSARLIPSATAVQPATAREATHAARIRPKDMGAVCQV
jgi:hypothetical protein